mmetsp:Transcript_42697/g.128145  ORF Transcript_42697/g.128145 Transcript_42697/m.128145 type:complete len:211 (+) Transcript_42697:492-1124(+)
MCKCHRPRIASAGSRARLAHAGTAGRSCPRRPWPCRGFACAPLLHARPPPCRPPAPRRDCRRRRATPRPWPSCPPSHAAPKPLCRWCAGPPLPERPERSCLRTGPASAQMGFNSAVTGPYRSRAAATAAHHEPTAAPGVQLSAAGRSPSLERPCTLYGRLGARADSASRVMMRLVSAPRSRGGAIGERQLAQNEQPPQALASGAVASQAS